MGPAKRYIPNDLKDLSQYKLVGIHESTLTSLGHPFSYDPTTDLARLDNDKQDPIVNDIPLGDGILLSLTLNEQSPVSEKLISDIPPPQILTLTEMLTENNRGPDLLLTNESQLVTKNKRQRKVQKVVCAGPNRFGRKGTIRCEVCRHWRRKVLFFPKQKLPNNLSNLKFLV